MIFFFEVGKIHSMMGIAKHYGNYEILRRLYTLRDRSETGEAVVSGKQVF